MNYLGEIKAIKEVEEGTYLKVFIPKEKMKYDIERFKQSGKVTAEIRLNDSRRITNEQRAKFFATVRDISLAEGEPEVLIESMFKYWYCTQNDKEWISMSNCSVTDARELINMQIDYILEHDIPLTDLGINRTDDVRAYLYKCIALRKCVCCGKVNSDFHHTTAVGMGRDRKKIDHVGMKGMTLCREHHNIIHQMGEKDFCEKHKVYPLTLDEYSVKKLKLSTEDIK